MPAFLRVIQNMQSHMPNKEIRKRELLYNETYHHLIMLIQWKNHSIIENDKI